MSASDIHSRLRRSAILIALPFVLAACAVTVNDGNTGSGGSDTGSTDAGSTDGGGTGSSDTGTGGGDNAGSGLAIVGSYVSDADTAFPSLHEVTEDTWTQTVAGFSLVFHITQYDNDAQFLVAQNDAANAYNAELWSRFEWLVAGDALYYCQSVLDAADEAAAAASGAADPSDLETGCAGFYWSELTPVLE